MNRRLILYGPRKTDGYRCYRDRWGRYADIETGHESMPPSRPQSNSVADFG